MFTDLAKLINLSITPGNIPQLDENEVEAVKNIVMVNTIRENCVLWSPSKPDYATINLTKNINNLNISKFLSEILNEIDKPIFLSIDFHGFYSDGEEVIFAWGSRNSNILPEEIMIVDFHVKGNQVFF